MKKVSYRELINVVSLLLHRRKIRSLKTERYETKEDLFGIICKSIPSVRMSMLEKCDKQLCFGVEEDNLIPLLAIFSVLNNENISSSTSYYSLLRNAKKDGFTTQISGEIISKITIWTESKSYFQTKHLNLYTRRLYKNSSYGGMIFKDSSSFDFGKKIFPLPAKPVNNIKVDAVYTWVNHSDENWQKDYAEHLKINKENADSNGLDRFYDRGEIFYSIKSIKKYAPWIEKIFIVTNCKPLEWMEKDSQITIIHHKDIIEQCYLPTFNSHGIESSLHHIKGLSNNFLYMNDDFFINDHVSKNDFFTHTGISKSNFENYGMVHGDSTSGDPDYLNAARNGKKLIENQFHYSPTRLHRHSPYALRIDILKEIENKHERILNQTRSNKFRGQNDISLTSFLFHHYSAALGLSIESDISNLLISRKINYKNALSKTLKTEKIKTFCINDGGNNSAHDNEWNKTIHSFFKTKFGDLV